MADLKQKARECAKEISDAIVDAESVGDILGAPRFAFFIERYLAQCVTDEREACVCRVLELFREDDPTVEEIAQTIRARKES